MMTIWTFSPVSLFFCLCYSRFYVVRLLSVSFLLYSFIIILLYLQSIRNFFLVFINKSQFIILKIFTRLINICMYSYIECNRFFLPELFFNFLIILLVLFGVNLIGRDVVEVMTNLVGIVYFP